MVDLIREIEELFYFRNNEITNLLSFIRKGAWIHKEFIIFFGEEGGADREEERISSRLLAQHRA